MAFWRGDEHRRAKRSAQWRKVLGAVTVPKSFIHPEEKQMADSPVPAEKDVEKLDAHPAPALVPKAQSFYAKHKTAIFVVAGAIAVFVLAHFVA